MTSDVAQRVLWVDTVDRKLYRVAQSILRSRELWRQIAIEQNPALDAKLDRPVTVEDFME